MEKPVLSISALWGGWGEEVGFGARLADSEALAPTESPLPLALKPHGLPRAWGQLPSLTTSLSLTCFPKWASNLRAGFQHHLFQKGICLSLAEDNPHRLFISNFFHVCFQTWFVVVKFPIFILLVFLLLFTLFVNIFFIIVFDYPANVKPL